MKTSDLAAVTAPNDGDFSTHVERSGCDNYPTSGGITVLPQRRDGGATIEVSPRSRKSFSFLRNSANGSSNPVEATS